MDSEEISEYYRTCDPYQGNLYSWTDLKFKTVGTIKVLQTEFCKPCEQNLDVANSMIIYGDQTAFVKCLEGFQLVGSPFIYCLRTSKWELSKIPSCKVVKCNPLKTPSNGRLHLTKLSYNGQAKFICDDGFALVGNETLTCLATGVWSDVIPTCASIFECSTLEKPENGKLVYASDSGVIDGELEAYPVGTFAEIICDPGFALEGENLISCTDQGLWDFDVEHCQEVKVEATTTTILLLSQVTTEFWREFKEFIFHSCSTERSKEKPELCNFYSSDFNSDMSTYELPEEFIGLDGKVLKLLTDVLDDDNFSSINVESFMSRLLHDNNVSDLTRDSYRFVICLYIDLIIIHIEIDENPEDDEEKPSDNINQRIMKITKKVVLQIFRNHQKFV